MHTHTHSMFVNVCVFMFRGELAEDSVDPLSVQRQSEETDPTQTVQVIAIISFINSTNTIILL